MSLNMFEKARKNNQYKTESEEEKLLAWFEPYEKMYLCLWKNLVQIKH